MHYASIIIIQFVELRYR